MSFMCFDRGFRGWIEIKYCHTTLYTSECDVYIINIEKGKEKHVSDHSTIYGNGDALIWSLIGFNGHLVEKIGTAPKQNLTES